MNIVVTTEEHLQKLFEESSEKIVRSILDEKSKKPKERFLTVEETAKHLKVTQQTVRNYIKQGKVKAKKTKGRVLVEYSSLDKLLEDVKSLSYKR